MADRHPVDPLAEIDTLLRAELAVQPSLEFLPRVRERIRTEPASSRWLARWISAPLAAVATLLIAAGLGYWNAADTTTPAAPTSPSAPVASTAYANAPDAAAPGIAHRIPRAERRERNGVDRVAKTEDRTPNTPPHGPSTERPLPNVEHRAPGPEVLIDTRQRDALLSFIAMARRGQVSAETFATTTLPPAAIADQVQLIALDGVAVSPIVPGGVLFFEVERK